MKRAHTITLTMFVLPGEDVEEQERLFLGLVPFSLADEGLSLQRSISKGFNDRDITVFSLRLEKERHTNAFLDAIAHRLSGAQKQQLISQENRLDDRLDFFLRFKKSSLPGRGLTDKGDCVHVRMSIAAFPKKKERALIIIKEIFK